MCSQIFVGGFVGSSRLFPEQALIIMRGLPGSPHVEDVAIILCELKVCPEAQYFVSTFLSFAFIFESMTAKRF